MFEEIRNRQATTKHLYIQRPAYVITEEELAQLESKEAERLLGYALFNLSKGNPVAAETLVRKAYVAVAGREWDS